jgi:hypothetical protein
VKSQSATPIAFRQLGAYSGPSNFPYSVTNQSTATGTSGQDNKVEFTSKATAAKSNSLSVDAAVDGILGWIGIKGAGSVSNSTTASNAVTLSYESINSNTVQQQSTVATTVADSSGAQADYNVLQDSIFQGIALQDTDMHFPSPGICWVVNGATFECNNSGLNGHVAINSAINSIGIAQSLGPKSHIKSSKFGKLITTDVASPDQIRSTALRLGRLKSQTHIPIPVPPPAPAQVVPVSTQDALRILTPLASRLPSLQSFIAHLH